ncbi:hypothetical protein ACH5RR_040306 [Cinchona calisaya]|uniref:Uncharacterized protein n=1 Tax=Cinchona calisaya TaxID=153742 RepID=A0ABD2XTS4_9GENT
MTSKDMGVKEFVFKHSRDVHGDSTMTGATERDNEGGGELREVRLGRVKKLGSGRVSGDQICEIGKGGACEEGVYGIKVGRVSEEGICGVNLGGASEEGVRGIGHPKVVSETESESEEESGNKSVAKTHEEVEKETEEDVENEIEEVIPIPFKKWTKKKISSPLTSDFIRSKLLVL